MHFSTTWYRLKITVQIKNKYKYFLLLSRGSEAVAKCHIFLCLEHVDLYYPNYLQRDKVRTVLYKFNSPFGRLRPTFSLVLGIAVCQERLQHFLDSIVGITMSCTGSMLMQSKPSLEQRQSQDFSYNNWNKIILVQLLLEEQHRL